MNLFLIAGEVSGDTHGAAVMGAFPGDAGIEFSGLGGPKMAAISPEKIEDWLADAAVLGLWEVLKKYGYFKAKLNETIERVLSEKLDAVVLIDYPGFNLRLAKQLRKRGYAGKLIYYISPQVWAWKRGRIAEMAQLLDLMICIFPFEKELYENSGLKTKFAGHPLIDSLAEKRANPPERESDLIALLPGSREREIEALFPAMLDAAAILKKKQPDLRFISTGANAALTDRLRELADAAGIELETAETAHEIMQRAVVGVVASGTATLEAACLGQPYCLTYKVAWLTALVARRVMKVDFLGIVNVMADREVVRELLQEKATGPAIAAELERLLTDDEARSNLQAEIAGVVAKLGEGGAAKNAAEAILAELKGHE
ncbi:MAG: lipid-A-disaccharide synthase [Verrucomicrobiales bacterium]|nr:lipid-A-disaccharide synthase [Verrucomicrobiales bacterium]